MISEMGIYLGDINLADWMGYIGLVFFFFSFQALSVRRTCLYLVPADAFYSLHFFMLGSPTAALISTLGAVRNFVAAFAGPRLLKAFFSFYILAVWIIAAITFTAPLSLLPALGTTLATTAMYYREDYLLSRYIMFAGQIVWLSFFLSLGSVPGILNIILVIGSNSVGVMRFIRQKKIGLPEGAAS